MQTHTNVYTGATLYLSQMMKNTNDYFPPKDLTNTIQGNSRHGYLTVNKNIMSLPLILKISHIKLTVYTLSCVFAYPDE